MAGPQGARGVRSDPSGEPAAGPAPFHFARGNLQKLLALPRYAWGAARSAWTRRDPNLWVIGSAFGVADGARAFLVAAQELTRPPRIVWLAGSPAEAAAARAAGVAEVLDRDSAAGLAATLRAGLVAVTHGFGDVNRYGVNGAVIVQLWHGAPLKKLHADSPAALQLGGLGRIPGMTQMMRWLYRRGTRRISLLPTGSQHFVPRLCSAFDLTPDQVRVLGEPRTDILFQGSPGDLTDAARALIGSPLGELAGQRVVLYAPTWRDGAPDPGVPSPDQWARIDSFCDQNRCLLVVRPHPLGVGDYVHRSPFVKLLPATAQPESMPLLWGVDILVTDYSSMLVDFATTGRPIVFLAPDLDEYRRTRGLYDDYAWLSGGRWHSDWDAVLSELERLVTDPEVLAQRRRHSDRLRQEFHAYTDGRNAVRVAEAAAALVEARFRR